MGYISAVEVEALARPLAKNAYGQYLLRMLSEKVF
jgi:glucose-1-phosphate thymidylyltransferase